MISAELFPLFHRNLSSKNMLENFILQVLLYFNSYVKIYNLWHNILEFVIF